MHDLEVVGAALGGDHFRGLPEVLGEPGAEEPYVTLLSTHVQMKSGAKDNSSCCGRVIHNYDSSVALFHRHDVLRAQGRISVASQNTEEGLYSQNSYKLLLLFAGLEIQIRWECANGVFAFE